MFVSISSSSAASIKFKVGCGADEGGIASLGGRQLQISRYINLTHQHHHHHYYILSNHHCKLDHPYHHNAGTATIIYVSCWYVIKVSATHSAALSNLASALSSFISLAFCSIDIRIIPVKWKYIFLEQIISSMAPALPWTFSLLLLAIPSEAVKQKHHQIRRHPFHFDF